MNILVITSGSHGDVVYLKKIYEQIKEQNKGNTLLMIDQQFYDYKDEN
jgi:choline kinase